MEREVYPCQVALFVFVAVFIAVPVVVIHFVSWAAWVLLVGSLIGLLTLFLAVYFYKKKTSVQGALVEARREYSKRLELQGILSEYAVQMYRASQECLGVVEQGLLDKLVLLEVHRGYPVLQALRDSNGGTSPKWYLDGYKQRLSEAIASARLSVDEESVSPSQLPGELTRRVDSLRALQKTPTGVLLSEYDEQDRFLNDRSEGSSP
jgi:hypothetical protein